MKYIDFKKLGKAFLIILLYLIIVPQIISLTILPFLKNLDNSKVLTIVNLSVYIIDVIIIFIIYRKSIFKEWHKFFKNFKNYTKIAIKNWGKGFLLMILFNIIIISLVGSLASNETQNREILNQYPIFSIIAMVFLGPILEEVAFRKGFKEAFKKKELFLIFTAILFGAVHVINELDYSSWQALLSSSKELLFILPYATLGYFFGKAYYETDCIFTSIMAHMFHNGLSVALILLASLIS